MAGLVPRIGNEADLAARTVAESVPGRPSDLSDFVYLSGEIGIGGAVVVDGRGMAGRHGWAGEIRHVTVDPDGPACPCGSTGCLERYAGKEAILTSAGLAASSAPADLVRAARSAMPARRMPSAEPRGRWASRSPASSTCWTSPRWCSVATWARSPTSCARTSSDTCAGGPCLRAG